MSVFERLAKIIYVFAGESNVELTMETNLVTEAGLNSFEFAQILYEIELEFDLPAEALEVGIKQIQTMKSLVDFVESIKGK